MTRLPAATERIRYAIPTFDVGGRPVVHLAGDCAPVSLHPVTDRTAEAVGEELAPAG